jgi:hypothetical protein
MTTMMKTQKKRKTKAQLQAEYFACDRLWKLLKIALIDLRECEANTRQFKIDMGTWVRKNGKCVVCLAGACMIKHQVKSSWLDVNRAFDSEQTDVIDRNSFSLNDLRLGYVKEAWCEFYNQASEFIPSFVRDLDQFEGMIDYDDDKKLWWKKMRKLLVDLKRVDV